MTKLQQVQVCCHPALYILFCFTEHSREGRHVSAALFSIENSVSTVSIRVL